MKILYLTKWEISETSGVYKKIIAQKKALERMGHSCDVLFVNDTSKAKIFCSTEFSTFDFDRKEDLENITHSYDACYVRFELLRHRYYKIVLDRISKQSIPIILEIPTFPPYEESMARVKEKIRRHKYLSAIKTSIGIAFVKHDMNKQIKMSQLVCNNGDPTVFKWTKTIRIENGIDFDQNPFICRKREQRINIVAVSNFAIWNGYDLAINGLKKYIETTGNDDIHITFVGDIDKASDLIELTKKNQLDDYISFTGLLGGEALDKEYEKANVALGALGDHRRKAFTNSSLKVKEYAARGLIMILSESEGIEKEIKLNSFIVPAKEEPVDFIAFINWYKVQDCEKISNITHDFALDNYSWDVQMEKIIRSL